MVLPSRHQLIGLIHPRQPLLLAAAGWRRLMAPIRQLLLAVACWRRLEAPISLLLLPAAGWRRLMAPIGLLLIAASDGRRLKAPIILLQWATSCGRRLKAQFALRLLTALKVPVCRLLLQIPVALDERRLEAPESWQLLNTTAGLKSVHAVLLA
jgi:hypothetical protein